MKEVLTKSFWQGVKKTYYEALEGPPPENNASPVPAEDTLKPAQTSETQSVSSPSNEEK
jgi:hypothetical protein